MSRYKEFKEFQTRILIASNLFGCGMDVKLEFNYDMLEDTDTYLHQVCVTTELLFVSFNYFILDCSCYGCFGTKGLAIIYVVDAREAAIHNEIQSRFEVQISEMPDKIDVNT